MGDYGDGPGGEGSTLGMRISAGVLLFFASAGGVCPPLLRGPASGDFEHGKGPMRMKAFAAGVMLGLAIMHVIADAFSDMSQLMARLSTAALSNSTEPPPGSSNSLHVRINHLVPVCPTRQEYPVAGLFVIGGLLFMFFVENVGADVLASMNTHASLSKKSAGPLVSRTGKTKDSDTEEPGGGRGSPGEEGGYASDGGGGGGGGGHHQHQHASLEMEERGGAAGYAAGRKHSSLRPFAENGHCDTTEERARLMQQRSSLSPVASAGMTPCRSGPRRARTTRTCRRSWPSPPRRSTRSTCREAGAAGATPTGCWYCTRWRVSAPSHCHLYRSRTAFRARCFVHSLYAVSVSSFDGARADRETLFWHPPDVAYTHTIRLPTQSPRFTPPPGPRAASSSSRTSSSSESSSTASSSGLTWG